MAATAVHVKTCPLCEAMCGLLVHVEDDRVVAVRPGLDAALPLLDCMISVHNYLNETTRHAQVILPGLSPLEQPHLAPGQLIDPPSNNAVVNGIPVRVEPAPDA